MAWTSQVNAKYQTATRWSSRVNAQFQTARRWRSQVNARYHTGSHWQSRVNSKFQTGRRWSSQVNAPYETVLVPAAIPLPPFAGGTLPDASSTPSIGLSGAAYGVQVSGRQPTMMVRGDGETLDASNVSLAAAVETGWTFGCDLAERYDLGNLLNKKFSVVVIDGMGGEKTSPPMLATDPCEDYVSIDGDGARLGGQSRAMWLMGADGQSFPSYRGLDRNPITSDGIVADLAARAGVQITGAPSFPVYEEDVKNSKLMDALARVCRVAGYTWVEDRNGKMRCVPWGVGGGAGQQLPASKVTHRVNAGARRTKFTWGRRSSFSGGGTATKKQFDAAGYHTFPLAHPVSNAFARDRSVSGYISLVLLWQGDPGKDGKLTRVLQLNGPTLTLGQVVKDGGWPVTHASVMVEGPSVGTLPVAAEVLIDGSPTGQVPSGIDDAFLHTHDTGETPVRPLPQPVIDPLFSSLAFVQGIAPRLASYANKDTDQLVFDCILYAHVDLLMNVSRSGMGSGPVVAASWSDTGGDGFGSTTVTAARLS